jgi:TrmH family RNA methyltransferase
VSEQQEDAAHEAGTQRQVRTGHTPDKADPEEVGFHHRAVREARLLHVKKHRQIRRCFLVEGPALVEAALDAGVRLERVFAQRDTCPPALVQRLRESPDVPVVFVSARTLASLAQTQTPQGVVAVAPFLHRPAADLADLVSPTGPVVVLALPSLSDPGNAGTLLRSAEAFGACAVCFGREAVEPYNDKVVRASMGSLFRLPVVCYGEWAELAAAAERAGLRIVAAEREAEDVRAVTLPERSLLVIGHERRGLGGIPREDVHLRVAIPHAPSVESLNAAVAGSILLYELDRRRHLPAAETVPAAARARTPTG